MKSQAAVLRKITPLDNLVLKTISPASGDIYQMAHRRPPMRAIPRLVHRSHVPDNLRESACQRAGAMGASKILTDVICLCCKGIPTITLFLHARIANIDRALEQRTI